MEFCINCGEKLVDGARFCAFCGTKVVIHAMQTPPPIQTSTPRQQEYIGKVYKCPNCGEVISQSTVRCPSCSYEISGKEANETVRRFAHQLMELENKRGQEKSSIGQTIANAFFNPSANNRGSTVDTQILSHIKCFPIPNSIEEISEFMYLAVGNIDVNLSKNTMFNNSPGVRQQGGVQREISDAWVAKMQQVYAKAERTFPNDSAFQQLRDIYVAKMKELKIKVR
ncbi:zinc ribbon domain-containing protein [Streptococcus suis]|uniref:zinc ribbon domain-containing protein n=1 Tax=Streptococcus suis TaxID=1307 RepID=UPI000422677B|nr:zinc ribbon domain-containing protein [Streptococcus suis]